MKKALIVVFTNLLVLAVLVTIGNLMAAGVILYSQSVKQQNFGEAHLLPNYNDLPWARTHFSDYNNLDRSQYHAFYGWKLPEFHSETINIDAEGSRNTPTTSTTDTNKIIAFFGGSTAWGLGASDETTIPAFFASQNPAYDARNYAVPAFNAHQSLNLFLEQFVRGDRPDVVVFYDGVNEIWSKCRSELDSFAHVREYEIRAFLQQRDDNPVLKVFAPMIDLAGRIRRKLSNDAQGHADKSYDCHTDPAKAEQVARNLLVDWSIVKHLVEGYGGKFVGVLQPQAFESGASYDTAHVKPGLEQQFLTVYPMIPALLDSEFGSLKENFLDLRRSLDGVEHVYIDWCHLSPNGNEIIAARIGEGI